MHHTGEKLFIDSASTTVYLSHTARDDNGLTRSALKLDANRHEPRGNDTVLDFTYATSQPPASIRNPARSYKSERNEVSATVTHLHSGDFRPRPKITLSKI
jgi:hypothetical protein